MSIRCLLLGLLILLASGARGWTELAPGLDHGEFTTSTPAPVGDSRITILRIDPALWELELVGASQSGDATLRTAPQWCRERDLVAAINAGMFATDYATHVGYLRSRDHVNNGNVNRYQSVAAFHPRAGVGQPPFRIFDLDDPAVAMDDILASYASAVQNLRLVKRPGENRWSRQDKRWSEAALGEDAQGRILFIFARSPFTMHELIEELLALDIGLVAAQHLEGGPEAQLHFQVGDHESTQVGSYETGFRLDDGNMEPWPVPNVLGIRPRHAAAPASGAPVPQPVETVPDPPSSPRSREAVDRVRPLLAHDLAAKGLRYGAPIFIRIFKQASELELWVEGEQTFELFRTYRICDFSGGLGPKERTGDKQSPEGFYFVTPGQLNPSSRFHLSFNLGYPNAYDRHHGRTGSALMVHGDCVSIGCYAMTDAGIEEIYALADAALRGGQPYFRAHVFPFRLTPENMLEHRYSRWYRFWKNLQAGYDYFEKLGRPPVVDVQDGKYIFNDS